MKCPYCLAPLEPEDEVCPECGHHLVGKKEKKD